MSSIHLIADDNGAGLSRDLRLLAQLLREAGHDVTITGLDDRSRLRSWFIYQYAQLRRLLSGWRHGRLRNRYDINIMIERLRLRFCRQARVNVLMPHPEWFRSKWLQQLASVDLVLTKTRHAERLFSELGCATQFIGFTGEDCLMPNVTRQLTFFHGPGQSPNKGTLPLLQLWSKHPEWPLLTVVWRLENAELPPLSANVRLIRNYLDQTELRRLQNSSAFHLCPSQAEGYGLYISEALSVGVVVITTDAAPMNELVTVERGVLVAAHAQNKQSLATLYDFDPAAMEAAIERCLAMSPEERQCLGQAARTWFLSNRDVFQHRLNDTINMLASHQAVEVEPFSHFYQ